MQKIFVAAGTLIALILPTSVAQAADGPVTTAVTATALGTPLSQTVPYDPNGLPELAAKAVTLTLTFSEPVSPDTPPACGTFSCHGTLPGIVLATGYDAAGDRLDFTMTDGCDDTTGFGCSTLGTTTWTGTATFFKPGTYTITQALSYSGTSALTAPITFTLAVAPKPVPKKPVIPTHFHTCAALHVYYKGGVEKRGAHNKGAALHRKPVVNTALYAREKSLDVDHDGVVCEV